MVPARHICPVYSWVSFDDHEAIATLSPGGLLFGARMAAPPEGTARAEVFGVYHDSVKLLGDNAVLPSLQVRIVQASVQDTSMCVLFSEESSFLQGVAAAPGRLRSDIFAGSMWNGGGCARAAAAAGLRRSVTIIAAGLGVKTCSEDTS